MNTELISSASWCRIAIMLTVVCFVLLPAQTIYAQLTDLDIDELRARGVDDGWTFTIGENPATQYALEDLCGFEAPPDWEKMATMDMSLGNKDLPSRFDWRDSSGVTPVKDQGGCGSCWAFATLGMMECAIKIKTGETVDLSEQWMVSCNTDGWGCDGGFVASDYLKWKTDACGQLGLVQEHHYPYAAADLPCFCPYPRELDYLIEGWSYVGGGTEAIKQAIVDFGPIYVSIFASSALQGYTGGIFNNCQASATDHAVVLVGWDDSQGTSGVWFLRNSWGTGWGEEGGYCRIEYGCNNVGSNANYIRFFPLIVTADNSFGPTPLMVDFEADVPGKNILSCTWQFGDGDQSPDVAPTHEYDDPGYYDIDLLVVTDGGMYVEQCEGMVSAFADTLRFSQTAFDASNKARIDVTLHNYLPIKQIDLPFTWDGPLNLRFDSMSTSGCRTEYFDLTVIESYVPMWKSAAVHLDAGAQPFLLPGDGDVVSLYFTNLSPSSSGGNEIRLTSYAAYEPIMITYAGEYLPEETPGMVFVSCCENTVGDANGIGGNEPTVSDIGTIVDFLFITGSPLSCPAEADANQSGGLLPVGTDISVSDISILVDYLFITGTPLKDCF